MQQAHPFSTRPVNDSMQHVIADMHRFLADWVGRFERVAAQTAAANRPDEELIQQIQEFESYRDDWERQRRAEQDNLEQSAEHLTEAWMRLEDQQRELMRSGAHPNSIPSQIAQATPTYPNSSHPDSTYPDSAPLAPTSIDGIDQRSMPPKVSEPAPTLRPAVAVVNERVAIPSDGVTRDVALRQFEKLKNQIASVRQ